MNCASSTLVAAASCLIATAVPSQSVVRVSIDSVGNELPAGANWGTISGNGRYAAFVAPDGVVPGDDNGFNDVFVRDLWNGVVRRVSITALGVQPNDQCFQPKLSDDGRFVAFSSWADNLAASDGNGHGTDIFVKDLETDALEHVSVSSAGVGGNGISAYHHLSGDGRYVSFYSYSTNLVANDTNGVVDTFLFDRQTATQECLSIEPLTGLPVGGGGEAALSDDGRVVVYRTLGSLGGPFGAMIWRDRQTGQHGPLGTWASGVYAPVNTAKVSGDGTKVLFDTTVSLSAADTDIQRDVYLLDIPTGSIELVSTAPSAGACYANALSDDGRFVAFSSVDPFDPADTNLVADSYLLDRANGALTLAIVSGSGQVGDTGAVISDCSDDGRFCVSTTRASNLVAADLNAALDVVVRDRCVAATWSYYGVGYPGVGGAVPGFALVGQPAIGTSPLVALQNAIGLPTLAALGAGTQQDNAVTEFGGTLLIGGAVPITLALPTTGLLRPLTIPNAIDLCGVHVYLQAFVVDPVAPAGVAFTRGIDAMIGG
ncbi:MAG: hypothetical protein H6835_18275 [Planctomycetes bacterium]|nr:hypothetical protein [Planctomycetota bacterium]